MDILLKLVNNAKAMVEVMHRLIYIKKDKIIDLMIQHFPYSINFTELMRYGNMNNKCYMLDLLKYTKLYYDEGKKSIDLYVNELYKYADYANENRSLNLIKLICDNSIIDINCLLPGAAHYNSKDIINYLIDKGGVRELKKSIGIACDDTNIGIFELLLNHSEKNKNDYINLFCNTWIAKRSMTSNIRVLKLLSENDKSIVKIAHISSYKDLYALANDCIDIKPFKISRHTKRYYRVRSLIGNIKRFACDQLMIYTIIDKNTINIIWQYLM
jgi:hypothetical protein